MAFIVRPIGQFFRKAFRKFFVKADEDDEFPKYTFPDTIEGFGYHFNEKGELVDDEGGRFQFVIKEDDREYNQQHYDALGELITEYLYQRMEKDLLLEKVFIPVDAKKDEPQGFIFQSSDAARCQDLMVIVNGAGVVRAGQWSRKLIINDSIEIGTQFPYIRRARDAGYGVIVLNTNQNEQTINGEAKDIRGSKYAEDHGVYVWEHVISKTEATNIVIVAHSYGGIVTCTMADRFLAEFQKRVFCIVFTDSVHSMERDLWSQPVKEFLRERAVNFASTYVPSDFMMQTSHDDDCLSVSAGTDEHERTSHACINSAFRFIRDNYITWTANKTMAPRHFKPLPDDLSEFSPANRRERMSRDGEGTSQSTAEKPAPERREGASGAQDAESQSKNGKGHEDQVSPETGKEGEETESKSVGKEGKADEAGAKKEADAKEDTKEAADPKEDTKEAADAKEDTKEAADTKEDTKEAADAKEDAKEAADTKEDTKEASDTKEDTKEEAEGKKTKEVTAEGPKE